MERTLQGGLVGNKRISSRPSGIPRSQSRLPRPSYIKPEAKENVAPSTRNIQSSSTLRIDARNVVSKNTLRTRTTSATSIPAKKLDTKFSSGLEKQRSRTLALVQNNDARDAKTSQSTVSRRVSRVPRSSTILGVCTSKVVNNISDQPSLSSTFKGVSKLTDTRQAISSDIEGGVVRETPIDRPPAEDCSKPHPTITVSEGDKSQRLREPGGNLVNCATNTTGLDLKKSGDAKSERRSTPRATDLPHCDRVSNQGKGFVLSRAKSIKGFVSRHVKPRQTKGSEADGGCLKAPDILTASLTSLPTQILHHTPHTRELSAIFPEDDPHASSRVNVKEIWTMADEMRLVRVGGIIHEEETLSPKKDVQVVPLFRRSRNGSSEHGNPGPSHFPDTPNLSYNPFQTISAAAEAIMNEDYDAVGTQGDTYAENRQKDLVPVPFQCEGTNHESEPSEGTRSKVPNDTPHRTPKTGATRKRAILNRAQSLVNLVNPKGSKPRH